MKNTNHIEVSTREFRSYLGSVTCMAKFISQYSKFHTKEFANKIIFIIINDDITPEDLASHMAAVNCENIGYYPLKSLSMRHDTSITEPAVVTIAHKHDYLCYVKEYADNKRFDVIILESIQYPRSGNGGYVDPEVMDKIKKKIDYYRQSEWCSTIIYLRGALNKSEDDSPNYTINSTSRFYFNDPGFPNFKEELMNRDVLETSSVNIQQIP